MPAPSSTLSTLRPELAGSLEQFSLASDRAGFIGLRLAPVVQVAKKSGTYGLIPLAQLLRTETTERAAGSPYKRGKFTFTTASFACVEHGYEEPVDDQEAELYAEYLDAEMLATERARDAVLRNFEIRWATAIFNATTFASYTAAVTNEWDDATNATPVADVNTARNNIYGSTGLWPDTLVINQKVANNLLNCDNIKDVVASQGAGSSILQGDITAQQLARAFGLQKVLIAGSSKNTSDEGIAASLSPIWSDEYAMICKTADTNDIKEPCIGRTLHWSADGSNIGVTIESYREEQTRSNVIRARMDTDEIIPYTPLGYLLSNVTT